MTCAAAVNGLYGLCRPLKLWGGKLDWLLYSAEVRL